MVYMRLCLMYVIHQASHSPSGTHVILSGQETPSLSPYIAIILAQWQGWGLLPILLPRE